MDEIPESDDTEPRPRLTQVRPSLRAGLLQAGSFPFFVEVSFEVAIALILLAMALLFSSLRAAYSAAAAFETPWDRRRNTSSPPERSHRFLLLVLQRISMLAAFLLLAFVLIRDIRLEDAGLRYFIGVVLLWLLCDAYVRLYSGRNAATITHRTVALTRPLLALLSPVSKWLLKTGIALGVVHPDKETNEEGLTETLIDSKEEKELLLGVASIGQTTIRQAMVSRPGITGFDVRMDFHELMDKINKSGFSRIPVYDGDLDTIEGILYVKDLLPYIQKDEHFHWQKLVRKAYLVPETKRLDDLLNEFQKRRVHIAMVVDEYGGTSGLITMEDIIEEIFGDINDEYDERETGNFVQLDTQTYLVVGSSSLNDVIRTLNLPPDYFDEKRRGNETLAGLMLELFTRFPRVGEEVSYRELLFRIHSASKKQINRVKIIVRAGVLPA